MKVGKAGKYKKRKTLDGWVYVIDNVSMPELVKVGYTTRTPQLRARELGGTASPTPYEVVFAVHVEDPSRLESLVHIALSDYRAGLEWFKCSHAVAISEIRTVVNNYSSFVIGNQYTRDSVFQEIKRPEKITLASVCIHAYCDLPRHRHFSYCQKHYELRSEIVA